MLILLLLLLVIICVVVFTVIVVNCCCRFCDCRFCRCCWYTVKASCKRTWLLFLFFYFPGTVSPIQVFPEFVFLTCGSFSVHPGIKNWLFVHILGSTCEYSTVIASSNYCTLRYTASLLWHYCFFHYLFSFCREKNIKGFIP